MLDAMPDDAGTDTAITMALARFVAGPAPQAVPDGVRHVLQTALVDAVGCGLFSLTTPACRIVAEYAAEAGGRSESSLWCGAGLVSTANAEFASARRSTASISTTITAPRSIRVPPSSPPPLPWLRSTVPAAPPCWPPSLRATR